MNKLYRLWTILSVLSIVLSACGGQAAPTATVVDANAIFTAAARTAEAKIALTAKAAKPTRTPTQPPAPTEAPAPTAQPITPTVAAAAPAVEAPAPQSVNGDAAEFVLDVTAPDDTLYKVDDSFTKTWRLKNIGSTTWTTQYAVYFVSGERMNAPESVAVPSTVIPGQTVDISVPMIAPTDPGSYTGFWMLRNADGQAFGIGSNANGAFYVKINVTSGSGSSSGTVSTATATTTGSTSGSKLPPTGAAPTSTAEATASSSSSSSSYFSSVVFTVDQSAAVGCPHEFVFTASFVAKKATVVSYDFEVDGIGNELNHNTELPAPDTISLKAGESWSRTFTLRYKKTGEGYIEFHITAPEQITKDIILELRCG